MARNALSSKPRGGKKLIWEELKKTIEEQAELYHDLLTLAKKKHEALKKANVTFVQRITKQEESFITKISLVENKKQSYIKQIKAQHNIHANLYLVKIIDMVNAPNKEVLFSAIDKLNAIIIELKIYTKKNQQLLHKEMQFVDFNINVMTNTVAGDTYAAKGQENGATRKRKMFDETI